MTFDLLLISDCKNNPNSGFLVTNWFHWFNNDFYCRWWPSWLPSWISRIVQGYPLDIRYRGPEDIESSEKNTISVGAGLSPKIRFGNLTVCYGVCIHVQLICSFSLNGGGHPFLLTLGQQFMVEYRFMALTDLLTIEQPFAGPKSINQ